MIKLFSEEDFNNSKYCDFLPLECEYCHSSFLIKKKYILMTERTVKNIKYNLNRFCSLKCKALFHTPLPTYVSCIQCGKVFKKLPSQIKKTKNNFCCHSCSAKWNNSHKKHGTRRSKLEYWIEKKDKRNISFIKNRIQ